MIRIVANEQPKTPPPNLPHGVGEECSPLPTSRAPWGRGVLSLPTSGEGWGGEKRAESTL